MVVVVVVKGDGRSRLMVKATIDTRMKDGHSSGFSARITIIIMMIL